ncbi:MAG: PAS domain S-box protein [Acidobacteria bacterium]|nr:PAS domain S-box protein [Acidobacteriota bacterium]
MGLQILTVLAILIPISLALVMPDTYGRRAVVIALIATAAGIPIIVMSRRGHVVGAGTFALTAMWCILTGACVTAAGIHNPAFNGYIIVIAAFGLLLGRRAAYTAVAASLVSGLVLLLLDANGFIPERVYTPAAVWVFNAIFFIMAAGVLDLATRQVTSSSEQAERESTERQQTEIQLLESEERFHRLADATHEGIVFSEHGIVIDANQQFAALLGYQLREIVGKRVTDTVAPESFDAVSAGILAGSEKTHEAMLVRKDGSKIDVEACPRMVPFEGRQIRVTAVRDITDQKRAGEERLRLLSAIEQAGEMFVICDPRALVQYVNRAVEHCTGYRRSAIVGHNVGLMLGAHEDDAVYQTLRRQVAAGQPWIGRLTCRRRDGSPYQADVSIASVRSASGEIVAVVGVGRDVTDDLVKEEERRQAQKMETIGRLAGGVAHDFNNLLSPILGYAELLLTELPADHPHREPVSIIHAAADRARHLTQQLLAFGRKQIIEVSPVDLAQVVHDFEPILRRTIREDIDIILRLSPEPTIIEGDTRQVEQILMNLAINAQDAMPHGGHLSIETAGVTLPESGPGAHPDSPQGAYVKLSVGDTGSGIDPSIIPHIFEPFFTTKETGRGTGLGLSTVHGIVTQLHGHIRVESTVGVGTRFHALLPRIEGVVAPVLERTGATAAQAGHETIVVAEDDDMVRGLVCGALRRRGYKVIEIAQPEQCLALLEAHEAVPDLLLTDVVMPKVNGRELHLRLSARYPGLKAVYMSGYLDDVIGDHGVLEEDVSFIQKPFSIEALTAKVRNRLEH